VSDFPIALHGERLTAVVVGGGRVGTRKALSLAGAGAQVLVVAPAITSELEEAERAHRVTVVRREYTADQMESAVLMLQNLKLDMLKFRSSGIGSVIEDQTSATQEARALSRDIGHVVEAAEELRKL
jgi:2-polyprenyl-6-methoxyphenol hydroxylase-like FAD-dependent oxidoreductase